MQGNWGGGGMGKQWPPLDPRSDPVSVEVRCLWEGAARTLDNHAGGVVPGTDAFDQWPVIDKLGEET